jgi:anti-anti-sigma factor
MEPRPFEIRIDEQGVLCLSGELDLEQADVLLDFAARHARGQRTLVLDCSGLTFLDSSGLRSILALASRIPEVVVLRNPRPNVRNVLSVVGIGEAVGVRIAPEA